MVTRCGSSVDDNRSSNRKLLPGLWKVIFCLMRTDCETDEYARKREPYYILTQHVRFRPGPKLGALDLFRGHWYYRCDAYMGQLAAHIFYAHRTTRHVSPYPLYIVSTIFIMMKSTIRVSNIIHACTVLESMKPCHGVSLGLFIYIYARIRKQYMKFEQVARFS